MPATPLATTKLGATQFVAGWPTWSIQSYQIVPCAENVFTIPVIIASNLVGC